MAKPNPMGATFAERAAAARGENDFETPSLAAPSAVPNSTFATRAGIVPPKPEPEPEPEPETEPEPEEVPVTETETEDADEKSVEPEDTENKAVQSGEDKSGRGNRRRS